MAISSTHTRARMYAHTHARTCHVFDVLHLRGFLCCITNFDIGRLILHKPDSILMSHNSDIALLMRFNNDSIHLACRHNHEYMQMSVVQAWHLNLHSDCHYSRTTCVILQSGLTVKGELAELLDTLIDLQQSYPLSDPSGTPATPFHHKLHSLLPLLLSAYGATLSSPDQSLLRVLLHINSIVFHSPEHQQVLQHQDQAAAAAAAATAGAASKRDAAMTAGINEHADKPNGDAVEDGGRAIGDADDVSNAEGQGGVGNGPITALLNGPLAMAGSVSF